MTEVDWALTFAVVSILMNVVTLVLVITMVLRELKS